MTEFVLVIGGGGREHALAWKLSLSPLVKHVYVSPGNAGTYTHGKFSNCDVDVSDHEEVVLYCRSKNINLVVVGPEDPLAKGLADHLKNAGIKCFGPCQKGAQIEASKEFAKHFMDKYKIPTAKWKSFKNTKDAQDHILSAPYNALVVKASGLAAGKGVIVGKTKEDAVNAVETLKQDKGLSAASDTLVIEELLSGEEVSVLCFSDGHHVSLMPPAQDHKRLLDGDQGPNTGGMGAYCRCPLLSKADMHHIREDILQRAVDGMREEGAPYVGVLYAGLMLTREGPKVLEFNCRFGDPETQVILPLLESDLYAVMLACVDGKLNGMDLKWSEDKHAVGVVVVSGGYPGSYPKGKSIKGLDTLVQDCYTVFHAGTCHKSGALLTSGGRVLTVVAVADSLKDAAEEAQSGAAKVHFEGAFFRTDIAQKGLQKIPSKGMTYKAAGVDIESADTLVDRIKTLVVQASRPEVCGGVGGFGGIFDLSGFSDPLLISKVGSMGEKLAVAVETHNYEILGSDLVASAVNELLCYGAEPLFFLDTFTCGKLDVEIATHVIRGITAACREAKCALIGGETAEMPGMYHDKDFDLTSFARGAVKRSLLLPQKTVSSGDVAIALHSASLNTDAIGILRRLMSKLKLNYKSALPFNASQTFENVLMAPRGIYVDALLPLLKEGAVKAAAYMGRKGLHESLRNILPEEHAVVVEGDKWKVPFIFKWIAQTANLRKVEMLRDFNLGLDMILLVDVSRVAEVLSHLKRSGKTASILGEICKVQKGLEGIEVLDYEKELFLADVKGPNSSKQRVAVITSDKGTTLKPLIDHCNNPRNLSNYEIAVVISTKDGQNLQVARDSGIPVQIVDITNLTEELKNHRIHMILVDSHFSGELFKPFLKDWEGKILNIHPSLLPSFDSSNAHQEAIDMGVRITGCTVHSLEVGGSKSVVFEQAAMHVEVGDTPQGLQRKVSELQQYIYPKTLEKVIQKTTNIPVANHTYVAHSREDLQKLDESIHQLIRSTRRPGFLENENLSCGVFDLKAAGYERPHLISGTDGVGTKLKIAQICNKHDTIGIDLVAMCVNDILTHGAEPLFFLEAFDCGAIKAETVLQVVSGIAEGCRQANCALIGAEVNELPDIYLNPKQALLEIEKYDVVGYAEGALLKDHLLPRVDNMKPGDSLIGLASSGVHSNGYSLVRKLVEVKNLRYQDPFPLDPSKTLGEVLLQPTRIYVQSLLSLMRAGLVKGAAHITGGGLTQNIPRVLPRHVKAVLQGSAWTVPPVLQWIAAEGQLSPEEMLQTFNCGLGMVLIVAREHEIEVLETLKSKGERASIVGVLAPLERGEEQVEVKNFELARLTIPKQKKKVGVLISGSGTNLQALIDYTQDPNNCSSAEIVLVLSNVAGVEGLTRASRAGIPTQVLSHKEFKKRVDFDMAVHKILIENGVEIVCLAGFMRIVSKEFVELWKGKLLNVHPAILPSFKGMNAHKLVLEYGAKITGCTVHFVEAEVDAGAIIQQAAVRVDPHDDEKAIQEKVKVLEHHIFPKALELLASGKIARDAHGKLKWNY